MRIKGHDLNDIIKYVALNVKYYFSNDQQLKKNGNKAYIFSVPTYSNIGDQLIAVAQNKFIKTYFKQYEIINIDDYLTISAILKNKHFDKGDLIFIQGGGNFGNLYPRADKDRRYILNYLKGYPIVSFPQSTYFSDDCEGRKSYNKMANILKNFDGKLLLIGRDKTSYRELRKLAGGG